MSTERASDVLATMRDDGSRRWLRPKLSPGRFLVRRQLVGYPLIALFVALPFIRINGRAGLRIDLPNRELDAFGAVFHATDTLLLMLFMVGSLLTVFLLTAVAGRVWCGYSCPQSVYLELVFRPLERLIEGRGHRTGNVGVARTILKLVVFALLSVALGNVFVAYFVGSEALSHWIVGSPMKAPGAFIAMAATSVLVFADFAWFREQMCTVTCPYARLQSALIDPESLTVRYDGQRGEPRLKPRDRKNGAAGGDCVDCGACVFTCPTGIDIRQGAQLECIACAQCADACDAIMVKIGKPRGLVGYDKPRWSSLVRRPRVVIYTVLVCAIATTFTLLARRDRSLEITLLANGAAPYAVMSDERVANTLRLKLVNQGSAPRDLTLTIADPQRHLDVGGGAVHLEPHATRTVNLLVTSAPTAFTHGVAHTALELRDQDGSVRRIEASLTGPFTGSTR